jgi:hypothetical protein
MRGLTIMPATTSTSAAASQASASLGGSPSVSPAAATSSGDGVSPAARAAASGSPPGSPAATAIAEAGRCRGSGCRQRMITRSAVGSRSRATLVMLTGAARSCICMSSISDAASKARFPVKIS